MDMAERCNVSVIGPADAQPMVFLHGFGCEQQMWSRVAPSFEQDHRVVLLDLVGSGGSDLSRYDFDKYATLNGYVADLLELTHELDLSDVVLVGHSVSAMIAVLAQRAEPALFTKLVLVAPSARYIDDVDYQGGSSQADIDGLLELMASNHLGWQAPLSGLVQPDGESPALSSEVEASFCRTRPDIAEHFAGVTFRGDNRADLPGVTAPTLVLQSRVDAVAPPSAGEFVRDAIPGASYQVIDTVGHCPHLSAPEATMSAIQAFLDR